MRLIALSLADPAENLALDEALLDSAEQGDAGLTLRIWESPVPFVVLGVGQMIAREAHLAHCEAGGVPVLRRCSAGGCVLQGPGCLNYVIAAPLAGWPELGHLHASYEIILGRIATALAARGVPAQQAGISDLAVDGGKISGNAQRRRRRAILHHGTLLYRPDYDAMARYLLEPEDRPGYRGARTHRDFVCAIPLDASAIQEAIREAFDAAGPAQAPTPAELAAARTLAENKYRAREWTFRR